MDDWALSDPLKKVYSHFECGIYLIKNGSPVNGAWIKDGYHQAEAGIFGSLNN